MEQDFVGLTQLAGITPDRQFIRDAEPDFLSTKALAIDATTVTVAELAELVQFLFGVIGRLRPPTADDFNALSDGARRHFKEMRTDAQH
ncbi:MAG TPA: hypothetical protein VF727_09440 [Allosphingosinicella sp.]|jgi:hypothetical protein